MTLFWYVFGARVMAEKSVLRRPQDIEEVINRGGSSAASQEENQEKERIFNLRVPESLVEQVDALRKRRTGKISRNTWILEAIADKIARESV
jgi:predicted HicB family RNase H-like nuclease